MSQLWIEAEKPQWDAMLQGISYDVRRILDDEPQSEQRHAFLAMLNTFTGITKEVVAYLPPGEQDTILNLCGTWLDIGLIFGRSPQALADILKRSGVGVCRLKTDAKEETDGSNELPVE